MSKARMMYLEGYGCSCHEHPPCSFCMALTLEEADVMWSGGYEGLHKYWKEQSEWVTIFNYE